MRQVGVPGLDDSGAGLRRKAARRDDRALEVRAKLACGNCMRAFLWVLTTHNVLGTLLAMKHELRAVTAQASGSIVNISSTVGSRGAPNVSLYVA